MTQGEFLTAHAILDETASHGPADTCALFRAHGLSAADVDAMRARGNVTGAACPASRSLPPHDRRRSTIVVGGTRGA